MDIYVDTEMNKLRWRRRIPNSTNNFELVLENAEDIDSERLKELLNEILEETHRGLTLSGRAQRELQRFFEHPDTPLKSSAYVLLSNWFLTSSGDRHSMLATRCEALWDALFPCRPLERLSSPEAGKNHVIVPSDFEAWWRRVLSAQGGDFRKVRTLSESNNNPSLYPQVAPGPEPAELMIATVNLPHVNSTSDRVRAKINNIEVEGSPRAMAELLRMLTDPKTTSEI